MAFKVCLLLALLAVAACRPSAPPPSYGPPPPPSYGPPPSYPADAPKYAFDYAVKDDYAGLDFGHDESREGYDTKGSYYVLLPDGRIQRVSYTVLGDAGYVAEVTYEGEAKQPEYKPAPPPSYPPPPPVYA